MTGRMASILLVLTLGSPLVVQGASPVLYYSSYNNNTIYAADEAGNVSVFASGGLINGPGGLAFDVAGNLYTANWNTGTVSKITPAGAVSTYASGFNTPWGLVFDNSGNLFVSNAGGGIGTTISKITPNSASITTFATGLSQPMQMAFDSSGNLYVANRQGNSVSKISPAGMVTPFASFAGIAGTLGPQGLAIDSHDNVFVGVLGTTGGNGYIEKITPGGILSTYLANAGNVQGVHTDVADNIYFGTNSFHFGSATAEINIVSPSLTDSYFSIPIGGTDAIPIPNAVPEPNSLAFFAGSCGILLLRRSRRQ